MLHDVFAYYLLPVSPFRILGIRLSYFIAFAKEYPAPFYLVSF